MIAILPPMKRLAPLFILFLFTRPAHALIYLPENTLESLLVRADAVVFATVAETSDAKNQATFDRDETVKGEVDAHITATGFLLRITTTDNRPRFANGDRILVFLGPATAAGTRPILHSQKLESDAEVKTMKACVAEILPVAATLADLDDLKKEFDEKALRTALTKLVISKNGYTQILVGRLMATRLSLRVKPAGWEEILTPALNSTRKELVHGALAWSATYEKLPDPIRTALEKITQNTSEKDLAIEAQQTLNTIARRP